MKLLYFLRHAKSSWENPDWQDFERPLNKRGKEDIPLMGALLKQRGIMPERIVSSPAERTYKTARKIAKIIGFPPDALVKDEELYEASVTDFFNIIAQQPDEVQKLMFVGHNPTLTDMVNLLARKIRIDNIPTCGICALRFEADNWLQIEEGSGELLFFEYPKKYKSADGLSDKEASL
mgnify:CR=1 FL=1